MMEKKAMSCHSIAFTWNVTFELVSMQLNCTIAESSEFHTAWDSKQ